MRKSGHFRRCVWVNGAGHNFFDVLREATPVVRAGDAEFPNYTLDDDLVCIIARRAVRNGQIFLNLIAVEPGARAAVIPTLENLRGAEAVDNAETAAPPGLEFIQAQILVLVQGNNVVWTTHNAPLRERSIQFYLRRAIEELGDPDAPADFLLRADLDANQLQEALATGIREIDLNVGGFASSLEEAFELERRQGVMEFLRGLLQQDPTPEQIAAAADVSMKVVLTPGRNIRVEAVKDLMTELGESVYNQRDDLYDEGFAIVTRSGLRLTRDKLTISRPFDVDGNRRLINSVQAQAGLRAIMRDLLENGVIDED